VEQISANELSLSGEKLKRGVGVALERRQSGGRRGKLRRNDHGESRVGRGRNYKRSTSGLVSIQRKKMRETSNERRRELGGGGLGGGLKRKVLSILRESVIVE